MVVPKNIKKISSQDLKQWMDDGKDIILVDTLINDHFNKVHLPGAKNACVFEVAFLEQIAALVFDENSQIVVYGSSEKSMDAETAAGMLFTAQVDFLSILGCISSSIS